METIDLFTEIKAHYKCFTNAEKKVANYIMTNPNDVLYMSITDLATKCDVGDASVFRFCKSLGLKGYQYFKMILAQNLSSSNINSESITGNIKKDDKLNNVCDKVLQSNISALNQTYKLLDMKNVNKAVDLIQNAKMINFFGVGSSCISALEAKNKFMTILPNVEFSFDSHMQAMSASLMSPDSLAIAFSYSGSTKDIIDTINIVKKSGAKTICITGHAKSPLADLVDISLLIGDNEGPMQGGLLSTKMSQLLIIDILYNEYFRRTIEKSKKNKEKTVEAVSEKLL